MRDLVSSPRQPEAHRRYYAGFVAVLVVCFTPFKTLTYILPTAFAAWMLVTTRGVVSRNRLVAVVGAAIALGVLYDLTADEFLVSNYVLALVTYSSFLPILIIDSVTLASPKLLEQLVNASAAMLLVQGGWGAVEAVYGFTQTGSFAGANGDYVEGTMHPWLAPEEGFSNPLFAINLALMLLVCISVPSLIRGRRRMHVSLAALVLVLASVMHVLIYSVVAIGLAFLLVRPTARAKSGSNRPLLLVALAVIGFSFLAMRTELGLLGDYAESVFEPEESPTPRAVLLARVASDLPDDAPLQPWIGVGPGQFSSRASLLASGFVLGGPETPTGVPLISPQTTHLAWNYCFSLVRLMYDRPGTSDGSTQQPFFSWLSMYTELGIIGVILVLGTAVRLIRRVQRRVRAHPQLRTQAIPFCGAVVLLLLLGLQENYWELPQGILVGLLLLKVLYANIMYADTNSSGRAESMS